MQRRNFLKALGSVVFAPLVALLPKRQASDGLVIDWRESVRKPAPSMGNYLYVSHHNLPNHYLTIATAFEHAKEGDTIYIQGDYEC